MRKWLYHRGGKRLWDVAGAGLSLALAALPLAVCVVLIRRESPGPGLIGQWRVGRNGRLFRLWKLRTMRGDAEADGQARFADEDDGRITRIGAWLRAWHGDELPQLWNVLRGQMSLVGPRPERPCFVAQFRDEIPGYDCRHWLRPGITGWAQVNLGYARDLRSARLKTAYDLDYLASSGWRRDWEIWRRTWEVAGRSLRRHRYQQARRMGPARADGGGAAAQAARAGAGAGSDAA